MAILKKLHGSMALTKKTDMLMVFSLHITILPYPWFFSVWAKKLHTFSDRNSAMQLHIHVAFI